MTNGNVPTGLPLIVSVGLPEGEGFIVVALWYPVPLKICCVG